MLGVYLASLVAALGAFGVQLLGGHDGGGGHDVAGGHDVSAGHGGSQSEGGHDHEATAWSLVASVRFWSFALLAFGMVGTALTVFGLAEVVVTAVIAAGSGVGSGFFAAGVIRRLASTPSTSHAGSRDAVGRVGRVIVPLVPGGLGKVRVEIKGAEVDYVARCAESVEADEWVLVEDSADGQVTVSRAPKELHR